MQKVWPSFKLPVLGREIMKHIFQSLKSGVVHIIRTLPLKSQASSLFRFILFFCIYFLSVAKLGCRLSDFCKQPVEL